MDWRDRIKKDIDDLRTVDLFSISEQIRLLKKARPTETTAPSLEEIRMMTSTSKSNWSDDVIKERQS